MDIAALSMGLSEAKIQEQANLSVMKLAMDTARARVGMVKELAVSSGSIERAAQPHLGGNIDVKV